MAATPLSSLIAQTRRYVRDWADLDVLTASLSNSATTVTVADTTIYQKRWPIEVDQELMLVRAIPNATTLTVSRGAYGSTAATHANAASVLIRPNFYAVEIIDALNEALYATFPLIYKPVLDASLTTDGSSYEYTVPNMPGTYRGRTIRIPRISGVQIKDAGDPAYRRRRRWQIKRGATPVIQFRGLEASGGTIRIEGYGPFSDFAAVTDTIDAQYPPEAEYILPIYAAASLLLSGEAGRVRQDSGAVDTREQANRVGSSASIGNQLMQRFYRELDRSSMPPMPKHVQAVM